MKSNQIWALMALVFFLGPIIYFSTRHPSHGQLELASQSPSSQAMVGSSFEDLIKSLGLKTYYANLHSHHFMEYIPPKKQKPAKSEDDDDDGGGDAFDAGPCQIMRNFPQDDGRPCQEGPQGSAVLIEADPIDYFELACDYAHEHGGLDILFVTPHTKNNSAEKHPNTDTDVDELRLRENKLKSINQKYGGRFFCGLGQEAGTISTGNHVGIFGTLPQDPQKSDPLFFKNGAFDQFFSLVKAALEKNPDIVFQLNHPDVKRDLFLGSQQDFQSLNSTSVKKCKLNPADTILSGRCGYDEVKKILNDYGLDDFGATHCFKYQNCPAPESLSMKDIKNSFAEMRAASGDPFRLIEIVQTRSFPPHVSQHGSATTNFRTEFDPVREREIFDPGKIEKVDPLIYSYIFYLNMGLKLSPTANQDNHFINYGSALASRTGLWMPSLSEESVMKTLKARLTFATEDRNAQLLTVINKTDGSLQLMGETVAPSEKLEYSVAYFDPDSEDQEAYFRIHFFYADEDLNFQKPRLNITRLAQIKNGVLSPPLITNSTDQQMTDDELKNYFSDTLIPIQSGRVVKLKIQPQQKAFYLFTELIQKQDSERVWSAPHWIQDSTPPISENHD